MAKNSFVTLKLRNEKRRMFRQTIDLNSFPHFINRQCRMCNQEKMCRWNYSFSQTGKPEYRTRCIDCDKVYDKLSKQRHMATNVRRAREKKQQIKIKCIEYLGGKCMECGYAISPRALTFHHLDRKGKEYSISQIKDWKWETIKNELDKCELVCFNCHMEKEELFENERNQ